MFQNNLHTVQTGSQTYKLTEPLIYDAPNLHIEVLKDYPFDGASIPRILWSVVGSPMSGDYTRAACVHDALYDTHLLSRKESDQLFKRLMKETGVHWLRYTLMYLGVRIGGWRNWPKTQQHKEHMSKFITLA